jgi:thioesterase domain-containing protein
VPESKQVKAAWWSEVRATVLDLVIPLATDPTAPPKGYPFYCVHSVSGAGGAEFGKLAELVSPDIPFYAFQVPSAQRTAGTGQSIAAMATRYRDALIEFHAAHYGDMPFYLGGWSAGVMVALEMAQQLTQMGLQPATLVAIDKCPRHTKAEIGPWNSTARNVALWLKRSWRNRTSLWGALQSLTKKLAVIFCHRQLYGGPDATYDSQAVIERMLIDKPANQRDFISAFYSQTCGYVPHRYFGKVLVIATDEGYRDRVVEGWRYIADHRKTVRLPGGHRDLILGDNAVLLAAVLQRELSLPSSIPLRVRFGLPFQSPLWLDRLGGM